MSDTPRQQKDAHPMKRTDSRDDAHLDDEEKLVDGRKDVDYPALLTRDVKGG